MILLNFRGFIKINAKFIILWKIFYSVETLFEYIKKYCPYYNIKKNEYPNFLITGGINDPRVSYAEPLKFGIKLKEYNMKYEIISKKLSELRDSEQEIINNIEKLTQFKLCQT